MKELGFFFLLATGFNISAVARVINVTQGHDIDSAYRL